MVGSKSAYCSSPHCKPAGLGVVVVARNAFLSEIGQGQGGGGGM